MTIDAIIASMMEKPPGCRAARAHHGCSL